MIEKINKVEKRIGSCHLRSSEIGRKRKWSME
jgi:hypothetical protein